ncbi:hypothetical protein [Pseudomonas sp. NFX15]|uniref:hypothetical protein n=1 Tax=Pseudomonas sp. NFX15 TaxID=2816958 RepID=UPI003BA2DEC4
MNLSRRLRGTGLLLLAVLTFVGLRPLLQLLVGEPEIALEIGGTYEAMRGHSSASFSPLIRGHHWLGIPMVDARLRFIDSQYGFTTPAARFFTVGFDDNVVVDIRMSPQIEPLLLEDALKVVGDLQDQWRQKGWVAKGRRTPIIADTPEWRAQLRHGVQPGLSYWQAGDKYQVMLVLARFKDHRHPVEERYLITLALSEPWISLQEAGHQKEFEEPQLPVSQSE